MLSSQSQVDQGSFIAAEVLSSTIPTARDIIPHGKKLCELNFVKCRYGDVLNKILNVESSVLRIAF